MLINNLRISPNEVLQSWLNTVYHLLVRNNKGEERGALKREEELINFLRLKSRRGSIPVSTVLQKWVRFFIISNFFNNKKHFPSLNLSNEGFFWGGTSTKIELYSATNIKIPVPFRFGKLHKRQCKTTKNPLLTPPPPGGGGLIMILDSFEGGV